MKMPVLITKIPKVMGNNLMLVMADLQKTTARKKKKKRKSSQLTGKRDL